jgi:malonyl CoA-acyl carrier protein transacylase
MLPVSAPFHCALMQPAQEEVARVLAGLAMHDPRIPVAANVTGGLVTTADAARDALIRQVTGAVRWVDCMQSRGTVAESRGRGICSSKSAPAKCSAACSSRSILR